MMDRLEMGCMLRDEAIEVRRRWFANVMLWDREHKEDAEAGSSRQRNW